MNTIIQEILRHDDQEQDDQLESPQVRRRLTMALKCRECKGECKGCVIDGSMNTGNWVVEVFKPLPLEEAKALRDYLP